MGTTRFWLGRAERNGDESDLAIETARTKLDSCNGRRAKGIVWRINMT